RLVRVGLWALWAGAERSREGPSEPYRIVSPTLNLHQHLRVSKGYKL
ncbi:hypothetical protein ACN38_g13194, partial [Penicillium nordicum]